MSIKGIFKKHGLAETMPRSGCLRLPGCNEKWLGSPGSRRTWTAKACCSFPCDSLLSMAEDWE